MSKRRSAPAPRPTREIVVAEGADFRILFDRETRDFAVEYRGAPIGWRATESEARRLVEQLRYEDARRSEYQRSKSMFREVTLVYHRPNEEPVFEVVRARPVGRAYTWSDPTNPGAGGVSLLFEGEDGCWFVQQINHFPSPNFRFCAIYFSFTSFEDAKYVFPDEVTYILEDAQRSA